MTTEKKFIYNKQDKKYHCKICDKSYKNIQKKDGEYYQYVLKHEEIICSKNNTRNHSKSTNTERSVTQYFKDKIGNIIVLDINGTLKKYKIKKILQKTRNEENKKNDTLVLLNDINTNKDIIIGIQTKGHDYVFVENWMNSKKILHILKENLEPEEFEECKIELINLKQNLNINQIKRQYNKYKNRKGKSKSVLKKLGMCVSINSDEEKMKVLNLNLKKFFIKGLTNKVDHFFYYIEQKGLNFHPSQLIYITDEYIKNKTLYFCPRNIYSSSGKTNLGHPDFFECEELYLENSIVRDINN